MINAAEGLSLVGGSAVVDVRSTSLFDTMLSSSGVVAAVIVLIPLGQLSVTVGAALQLTTNRLKGHSFYVADEAGPATETPPPPSQITLFAAYVISNGDMILVNGIDSRIAINGNTISGPAAAEVTEAYAAVLHAGPEVGTGGADSTIAMRDHASVSLSNNTAKNMDFGDIGASPRRRVGAAAFRLIAGTGSQLILQGAVRLAMEGNVAGDMSLGGPAPGSGGASWLYAAQIELSDHFEAFDGAVILIYRNTVERAVLPEGGGAGGQLSVYAAGIRSGTSDDSNFLIYSGGVVMIEENAVVACSTELTEEADGASASANRVALSTVGVLFTALTARVAVGARKGEGGGLLSLSYNSVSLSDVPSGSNASMPIMRPSGVARAVAVSISAGSLFAGIEVGPLPPRPSLSSTDPLWWGVPHAFVRGGPSSAFITNSNNHTSNNAAVRNVGGARHRHDSAPQTRRRAERRVTTTAPLSGPPSTVAVR